MKHRVTIIAIGALVAVGAAAYYARDRLAPGPGAVAGVKADAKADGKADSKGAPARAAREDPRRWKS